MSNENKALMLYNKMASMTKCFTYSLSRGMREGRGSADKHLMEKKRPNVKVFWFRDFTMLMFIVFDNSVKQISQTIIAFLSFMID